MNAMVRRSASGRHADSQMRAVLRPGDHLDGRSIELRSQDVRHIRDHTPIGKVLGESACQLPHTSNVILQAPSRSEMS